MAKFYERIARWCFYLLAFLVPLIYFPWTVDTLEVNKQTVLLLVTSVSVIAWLGMMVAHKKFYFKKSWSFLIAGLFVLAVAVSSFLSLAPYVSWVGQGVQEYTSFLSILAFVLIFLVGVHFLSLTKVQQVIWFLMLTASALIGLNILLAFFNLPAFATNFIGTPNALALYLTVMAILGSGLWLVSGESRTQKVLLSGSWGIVTKVAIVLTVIAALVVTLSLDYWIFWIAFLLGVGLMFVFALLRAEEFPNTARFVLPMILFVVAIIFLFLPSVFGGRFAVEVAPSISGTWQIAKSTLADGHLLFGSGPGTFAIDYAQHRLVEVNETRFWDVDFDRGGSHVLTMLATYGVVGTLLFLAFVGWILVTSLKMLITQRAHDEWKMTFVAFSGWAVVTFGLFVYSSNLTLSFLFWMLSAVLMSQTGAKIQSWEFSKNPRFGLLTAFLFVLVNISLLTVMFVSVSRYAAEIAFARAVSVDRTGGDVDQVIADLDRAARLNKLSDLYYRNLGQALLVKTAAVFSNPDADPNQGSEFIVTSINAAKRATELSPHNVNNWILLGDIYREVSPVVTNADAFSVSSFTRATELAPSNPKFFTSLGRSYIVYADQQTILTESEDAETAETATEERNLALEASVEALLRAVELKPDYAPAHYYLALAYERQGNLADAVARMESVKGVSPNDIGVAFQLGLLYLKQGKTDLAQGEFERSLQIAPNYSNARWYLSAVYEQNGDLASAIEQVEKILELNPGNTLIEQRLERLRAGTNEPETLPEPLEAGEDGATDIEESLITE